MIEHIDVQRGQLQEFRNRAIPIHGVTAHREIRRIDLQQETRSNNGLVLDAHGLGECLEVFVLRLVEVIRLKQGNDTR